jgi:hypothetical protein
LARITRISSHQLKGLIDDLALVVEDQNLTGLRIINVYIRQLAHLINDAICAHDYYIFD